jgi:K+/H+ antiporter YhaU regulatory subunit KhtT
MSEIAGTALRRIGVLKKLTRGPLVYNQSGHVLILGWSDRCYELITELVQGHLGNRKLRIVLLTSEPVSVIKKRLLKVATAASNAWISIYTGDFTAADDLDRVNLAGAKAVIVLNEEQDDDSLALETVQSVLDANLNHRQSIVVELSQSDSKAQLSAHAHPRLNSVSSDEIVAKVLTQSARAAGLGAITLDLLDFAGEEVYFHQVPALAGKTYADAILAFGRASVIGLRNEDGRVTLNPDQSTKLNAGDGVIAIARDELSVVYSGVREDLAATEVVKMPVSKPAPVNLLITGWSSLGQSIIAQLDLFAGKGSTVTILLDPAVASKQTLKAATDFAKQGAKNLKISVSELGAEPTSVSSFAAAKKFDQIIVLAYRDEVSSSEADLKTQELLADLGSLFSTSGSAESPHLSRITAEIREPEAHESLAKANPSATLVSHRLASLLMAQLSTSPSRAEVFDQLFAPTGTAVSLHSIELYSSVGETCEFGDLVASARNRGQSAIGYLVKAHSLLDPMGGVLLNPPKNQTLELSAGDRLIVIG